MALLTQNNVNDIISSCQEGAWVMSQALNQCLDSNFRLEIGEAVAWDEAIGEGTYNGRGLSVAFDIEGQGVVCLIPASLPLPDWCLSPNDSQKSLLNALAENWSQAILPVDLQPSRFLAKTVADLSEEVIAANPAEWSLALEILVFDAASDVESGQTDPADESAEIKDAAAEQPDTTDTPESPAEDSPTGAADDSAEANAIEAAEAGTSTPATTAAESSVAPIGKIVIVWPLAEPPFPGAKKVEETRIETKVEPAKSAASQVLSRLGKLPVRVVVRLAEKKIEIGQLLGLAPGALITFSKPCEGLLDLYVNNQCYCRGEAVKIGEKFGLKVNEIGPRKERRQSVHGD